MNSWDEDNSWPQNANCSECALHIARAGLDTPFGYDEERALSYSSAAADCGIEANFTTPSKPYRQRKEPESRRLRTKICEQPYTVKAGDTCISIALAQNVSSNGITQLNGMDVYCSDMPPPETEICLPKACRVRQIQENEPCWSVLEKAVGAAELHEWNANVDSTCANVPSLSGAVICMSPPNGTVPDAPKPRFTHVRPAWVKPFNLTENTLLLQKEFDRCGMSTRELLSTPGAWTACVNRTRDN